MCSNSFLRRLLDQSYLIQIAKKVDTVASSFMAQYHCTSGFKSPAYRSEQRWTVGGNGKRLLGEAFRSVKCLTAGISHLLGKSDNKKTLLCSTIQGTVWVKRGKVEWTENWKPTESYCPGCSHVWHLSLLPLWYNNVSYTVGLMTKM